MKPFETSYSERLRHPKWQKRRLQIMERDGWKCSSCGVDDQPLNVHHRRYIRGREPWEYCDLDLMTLCDKCHAMTHRVIDAFRNVPERRRLELLNELFGPETLKIRRGPFFFVREPKISPGCVVFHIPTGYWTASKLPPDEMAAFYDSGPEVREEIVRVVLEGPSAVD